MTRYGAMALPCRTPCASGSADFAVRPHIGTIPRYCLTAQSRQRCADLRFGTERPASRSSNALTGLAGFGVCVVSSSSRLSALR